MCHGSPVSSREWSIRRSIPNLGTLFELSCRGIGGDRHTRPITSRYEPTAADLIITQVSSFLVLALVPHLSIRSMAFCCYRDISCSTSASRRGRFPCKSRLLYHSVIRSI